MHGVIHRELKEFVDERMGDGAWERVREDAGIEPKLYLPVSNYPDAEFDALVEAVASRSGNNRRVVLENFGEFLAPELLGTFRSHVREGWDVLDLLENLEHIYDRVGGQSEETEMPSINCDRVVSDMVVLTYSSGRALCPMGEGIIRGIAAEYDEPLSIEQDRCLLEGDDRCEFTVERA